MRCPFCGDLDSQVKDSRSSEDGAAIRRRRQCEGCGARFTTFERVQLRDLTVVKKSGRREAFDRAKLARSIGFACRKRDIAPVTPDEIKGVKGYEFYVLTMTVFGELDKIAQLLKGLDQKGFLIKNISLFQNKGPDNPELKLDLTLARIVKVEQEEDGGPRRPGSRRLGTGGGRRP